MTSTTPPDRTERLPDPPFFRAFPFNLAPRFAARSDIRATEAQLAAFREFATVGDPLADALVAEMRELPAGTGRRLFEQALEEGVGAVADPPPALAAFFAEVETMPVWLDPAKLDLAAKTMTRTGLAGVFGPLGDVALIGGYLASRPDKVLVRSGDLERKAGRRLAETANWWVEVSEIGGLERDAPGFKGVVHVRLTHAHIRAAMHRRDDWDYEEWDHPVNQIHTVGTLILFSLVFTVGLQLLGFRFSAKEKDAIYHLWRYVGYLMGVDPALLPADEADTWRITWLEGATEFIPDDDSRRLAEAMYAAGGEIHGITGDDPASRLAIWVLMNSHAAYSRIVLGNRNADRLGIPSLPAFGAVVAAAAGANFALETVRRSVPGATRLSVLIGGATRRAAIRRVTGATAADLTYTREGAGPAAPERAAA